LIIRKALQITLCLGLGLICGGFAQGQEAAPLPAPHPLSLAESLAIALKKNPAVQIAEQQAQRASAQVREAKAGYGPFMGATVTHTRSGPIPTVTLPSGSGSTSFAIGVDQSTSAVISLGFPLDLSSAIGSAVNAADFNYLASRFSLAETRQSVALQVQEVYLGILRSESLQTVAEDAVKDAEENLRVAQAKFTAGSVPRFDVLRSEVNLASAQQNQVEAKNGVDLAKSSFNRVLGESVNQPVEVEKPSEAPLSAIAPLEDNQQIALKRRPEILRDQASAKAAEKGIKIAKAGLLPSMTIIGNQNYNANPGGLGGQKSSWNVNAALTLPVFDRGRTRARIDEARADTASARLSEENTRQQVMLEVRQAQLNITAAEERLKVTEKDVEQAKEALRLAQLRYQAGISTPVEVIDAEVALTSSKTNQVNSYYDLLIARAELDKAIGNPAPEAAK
jgi:outer membrane protein